jgi:hypothetical protein
VGVVRQDAFGNNVLASGNSIELELLHGNLCSHTGGYEDLCDITPRIPMKVNRRFGGICGVHILG